MFKFYKFLALFAFFSLIGWLRTERLLEFWQSLALSVCGSVVIFQVFNKIKDIRKSNR